LYYLFHDFFHDCSLLLFALGLAEAQIRLEHQTALLQQFVQFVQHNTDKECKVLHDGECPDEDVGLGHVAADR
jgi:hypothetical protein